MQGKSQGGRAIVRDRTEIGIRVVSFEGFPRATVECWDPPPVLASSPLLPEMARERVHGAVVLIDVPFAGTAEGVADEARDALRESFDDAEDVLEWVRSAGHLDLLSTMNASPGALHTQAAGIRGGGRLPEFAWDPRLLPVLLVANTIHSRKASLATSRAGKRAKSRLGKLVGPPRSPSSTPDLPSSSDDDEDDEGAAVRPAARPAVGAPGAAGAAARGGVLVGASGSKAGSRAPAKGVEEAEDPVLREALRAQVEAFAARHRCLLEWVSLRNDTNVGMSFRTLLACVLPRLRLTTVQEMLDENPLGGGGGATGRAAGGSAKSSKV